MRLLAVATFLLACSTLLAQGEAYDLKTGQAKAGDKAKFPVIHADERTTTTSINGKSNTHTEKTGAKFVYVETLIEKPNPKMKPTKLNRTYETAEVTNAGKTTRLFYDGRTVAIESKMGRYEILADGKPMEPKDAGMLAAEFSDARASKMGKSLLPGKAVKLNEAWTIATDQVLAGDQHTVDKALSKATGKLAKVYEKDGRRYGAFVIEADLKLSESRVVGSRLAPVKAGSNLTLTMNFDVTIDDGTPYGCVKSVSKSDITIEARTSTRTIKANETSEATTAPVK